MSSRLLPPGGSPWRRYSTLRRNTTALGRFPTSGICWPQRRRDSFSCKKHVIMRCRFSSLFPSLLLLFGRQSKRWGRRRTGMVVGQFDRQCGRLLVKFALYPPGEASEGYGYVWRVVCVISLGLSMGPGSFKEQKNATEVLTGHLSSLCLPACSGAKRDVETTACQSSPASEQAAQTEAATTTTASIPSPLGFSPDPALQKLPVC